MPLASQPVTIITRDLLARLREALHRRAPATIGDVGAQRAAVAVVVSDETRPGLLFVKRHERAGDPWSGHVAFPGGFQSSTDQSAAETAARETEEETGLALAVAGELLGYLDDVHPRSVHLPPVVVTPAVFRVAGRPAVHPRAEVERATWLPVSDVFDPANRRPFELVLPGEKRDFEAIVVDDLTIWGLTERILAQLASIL